MARAKKSLGQNFLVDPNVQRKIVEALAAGPDDDVLEIGPGTGALTRRLAGNVRRLVAVELDDALAAGLARDFRTRADVAILHADFLDLTPADVSTRPEQLKVVGNIPYNITTPLLFRLLGRDWRPRVIVVMVQREVADRILAEPGSREYGALSVGVRSVASVEKLFGVGRRSFRPVPRVESTVLRITPMRPPPLQEQEEQDLRALTRAAFGWRRKQLQKILRAAPEYGLDAAEVDSVERETGLHLDARPEALGPDDLIMLSRALRRAGRPLLPGTHGEAGSNGDAPKADP